MAISSTESVPVSPPEAQRKNYCVRVVVTKAAGVLIGGNLVGDVNFLGAKSSMA